MTTFPYGYARPPEGGPQGMGTQLTWDQMMTKKTVYNMHPEVQRRFKALIEFAAVCGVPLGVGTSWRVQPNPPPPGFAKPGNSWHESCPVDPVSGTALAIDTVPNISWDWMERNCATYGLRSFRNVNNEPWHVQPVEIAAGRKMATTLPPINTFDLPGEDVPPPVIPPPAGGTNPEWVTWVMNNQPVLKKGASGVNVRRMQHLLAADGNMNEANTANYDGQFGSGTESALKGFQSEAGGTPDGICGPWSWGALMHTIDSIPTIKKGATGPDVKRMQHLLASAGYMDPANTSNYDGIWGNGTDGAKQRFDADYHTGTPSDSSCGPMSWESLLNGWVW